MKFFLKFFVLLVMSFFCSTASSVYSTASSTPPEMTIRNELQDAIHSIRCCVQARQNCILCPELFLCNNKQYLKANKDIECHSKKIKDLLQKDSNIMACDIFFQDGVKKQNPFSLLQIAIAYHLYDIGHFLLVHRKGTTIAAQLIEQCFTAFFARSLSILKEMAIKLNTINISDAEKYRNYTDVCLQEIRTLKQVFNRYLPLFDKDLINAHWFILKEAFFLPLKLKFNDEIDQELSLFYQSLLPYYSLDYEENNYLHIFNEICIDPKHVQKKEKNLHFYETIQKIGKELYLKEFELFKQDKDRSKHKGLLFNLIKYGCFTQLDELVKSSDDFNLLVDVGDLQFVLVELKELEELKKRDLFSENSFFEVFKAGFRFFSYIFDAGFYVTCLYRDKDKEMFKRLMKPASLQGLNLIHRAVRGGNVEAVKFLLNLDPEQINFQTTKRHIIKDLTPICFLNDIKDSEKKDQLVAFFKTWFKQKNRNLTELEERHLGPVIVQSFKKSLSSEKLRQLWRNMAEKFIETRNEHDFKKNCDALKKEILVYKQQKAFQYQQQDLLKEESLARSALGGVYAKDLLSVFIDKEGAARNSLERELLPEYTNGLQLHDRLRFMHEESLKRTDLENEETLLAEPLRVPFYVGQASANTQLKDLSERLSSFQAASPSKGKGYLSSQASASGSTSSLKSVGLGDTDLQVELCKTPRGISKVTYILGGDSMANKPQMIILNDQTNMLLNQLGQAEQNPFTPLSSIAQVIPCHERVEKMRALNVTDDFIQVLENGNFDRLDHAMSTDFIRKIIQCGSVYGQLRMDKPQERAFMVTIVASIQESSYIGRFESIKPLKDRAQKKWVTLSFEIPEDLTGDEVLFGRVFHVCVQEKHPRFIQDDNGYLKYLLAPLGNVAAVFDKNILKLTCVAHHLVGVKNFLNRMKTALLLRLGEFEEEYDKQWKPLK